MNYKVFIVSYYTDADNAKDAQMLNVYSTLDKAIAAVAEFNKKYDDCFITEAEVL